MSELTVLCHALQASVEPLPGLVNSLQQRAARLLSLAAEVDRAARQVSQGPKVSRVVQALHEAARELETSGRALTAAVHQSRSYVDRTIGGSGSGTTGGVAATRQVSTAERGKVQKTLDRQIRSAFTSEEMIEGVWNPVGAVVADAILDHMTGFGGAAEGIAAAASAVEVFLRGGGLALLEGELSHLIAAFLPAVRDKK